jgi:hypothetical protein
LLLASQPERKLRVLVVEDDPADVELVLSCTAASKTRNSQAGFATAQILFR